MLANMFLNNYLCADKFILHLINFVLDSDFLEGKTTNAKQFHGFSVSVF